MTKIDEPWVKAAIIGGSILGGGGDPHKGMSYAKLAGEFSTGVKDSELLQEAEQKMEELGRQENNRG